MNFLPKLWDFIKKISLVIALITVVITGGWAVYLYDLSQKSQVVDKQLIVEGDNALNIGRYADAKRIFAAEFKAHPENKHAEWSLNVAQIRETKPWPEFKEAVDDLYQENPNDANVNLFMGEYYAANNDPDKAFQHYLKAIEQSPKLAEAHYHRAMLYEKQGDLESAKVEALQAIEISPTPKYRNILGTIYFNQQLYEKAIKEYGKNKEYPLSAFESAHIYWRLEFLSQAMSYQKQALEWLENDVIMSKPDNQEAWYFEVISGKSVDLVTLDEKKSYAHYNLSVSLYLQGDTEATELEVQKARDLMVARQADINSLLLAELDALVQANGDFAEQVAAYKKLYF